MSDRQATISKNVNIDQAKSSQFIAFVVLKEGLQNVFS